ncbi:hypothetical protein [Spiroplasma endosymbiont of Amphimallon solstitiale]|uniref:hypothetical protein n=1 Tax=Spiroplasma endosymbiont of Amphimallon solstitiale TaxID=3066288 RepID=UPI00313B6AA9
MNKDQEIINEYNRKRNIEITEEHLHNIEKLREEFKQKVINEYKEKLINYIKKQQKFYNGTEIDLILDILLQKIINGEFNNE